MLNSPRAAARISSRQTPTATPSRARSQNYYFETALSTMSTCTDCPQGRCARGPGSSPGVRFRFLAGSFASSLDLEEELVSSSGVACGAEGRMIAEGGFWTY